MCAERLQHGPTGPHLSAPTHFQSSQIPFPEYSLPWRVGPRGCALGQKARAFRSQQEREISLNSNSRIVGNVGVGALNTNPAHPRGHPSPVSAPIRTQNHHFCWQPHTAACLAAWVVAVAQRRRMAATSPTREAQDIQGVVGGQGAGKKPILRYLLTYCQRPSP